jgi:hypothetical protein
VFGCLDAADCHAGGEEGQGQREEVRAGKSQPDLGRREQRDAHRQDPDRAAPAEANRISQAGHEPRVAATL